jgi:hypothetical protein
MRNMFIYLGIDGMYVRSDQRSFSHTYLPAHIHTCMHTYSYIFLKTIEGINTSLFLHPRSAPCTMVPGRLAPNSSLTAKKPRQRPEVI